MLYIVAASERESRARIHLHNTSPVRSNRWFYFSASSFPFSFCPAFLRVRKVSYSVLPSRAFSAHLVWPTLSGVSVKHIEPRTEEERTIARGKFLRPRSSLCSLLTPLTPVTGRLVKVETEIEPDTKRHIAYEQH